MLAGVRGLVLGPFDVPVDQRAVLVRNAHMDIEAAELLLDLDRVQARGIDKDRLGDIVKSLHDTTPAATDQKLGLGIDPVSSAEGFQPVFHFAFPRVVIVSWKQEQRLREPQTPELLTELVADTLDP